LPALAGIREPDSIGQGWVAATVWVSVFGVEVLAQAAQIETAVQIKRFLSMCQSPYKLVAGALHTVEFRASPKGN
jgi:hypothetical protein